MGWNGTLCRENGLSLSTRPGCDMHARPNTAAFSMSVLRVARFPRLMTSAKRHHIFISLLC